MSAVSRQPTPPPTSVVVASPSERLTETDLIYFSSASENTRRFIDKLEVTAARIPLRRGDDSLVALRPFVLITPTYGGGEGTGAVPKQVVTFLNDPRNRGLLQGVIAAGNTNFGAAYGLAGDVISAKCRVPMLYRFELFGTPRDVERVRDGLDGFWHRAPNVAPDTPADEGIDKEDCSR
ncbi:class Ib ribonucleoside-diphosphate reductase assembly flavoprotein NrdI [Brachybacterium kimchii]|uniref:Protein NrdI n=1 Tax=Brachybacterium kimchii TaxID=2942909 RepID=A0ABY4NB49_9MICO|nr:class Ib ribonucleoside-diphosphate reductase assembly flavoprotein NrdI [Brachybacterium kimchii]UQN30520.1 class Ib ribonucleoside-diphosphate reductase assembly flavoprotein NrdI [Brachybacterium kimchii]